MFFDISPIKNFPNRWFWFFPVVAALFFLWLQSNNCSLHPGRDMVTYWSCYRELFKVQPGSATLLLFRPPFTPLFFGTLFDMFGAVGVQTVLSALYVACLVAVFAVGASLSVWVGFLALILLGANIQYHYWFFGVGSESPQSFLLVLWSAYAFFTFNSRHFRSWVLQAVLVWLLVLNRPGNQVLVLCFLFPLLNLHMVWKRRVLFSLVFLMAYGTLHVAYASYNYARLGYFQVATLGNAHLPFYRLFLQDRMIRPDNGPKSQELAYLVEEKILPLDVYRKYQIDLNVFFTYSSQRMYNQLTSAVSRAYGWDHQWLILRQAAMEAVVRHPVEFVLTYIDHLRDVFYIRGDGRYDLSGRLWSRPEYGQFLRQRYLLYEELGLTISSENDLLPNLMPEKDSKSAADYTQQTIFNAKKPPVEWTFPGSCRFHWGNVFDMYGIKFPFAAFFIFVGIIGFVLSMMRKVFHSYVAMVSITMVAFLNLAASLMGSVQIPFRFPFDSIFILFGCFGLHGILSFVRKRD